MSSQQTYSFLDVTATIVGPGGGFSLGAGAGVAEEGISVDFTSEVNTMAVGADGTGQHTLHADKSGRVTVKLLKTSPTNGALSALLAFQRSSASLHGQNTIVITDMNRGDVITCRQCAFSKSPSVQYAREAGTIDWEFGCISIDMTLA
jgi:hypothetical protein